MAFTAKLLRPVGDHASSGVAPVLWIYDNAAGDTVTTAGFIPAGYGVKARDQVIVVASNGTSAFYHASVSGSTITLTANS